MLVSTFGFEGDSKPKFYMMQEARATRVLTLSQASQLLPSTSSSQVFSDMLVVADFNR